MKCTLITFDEFTAFKEWKWNSYLCSMKEGPILTAKMT